MFAIIGIVIVFGAVLGGFLMEKGPLLVLMQPSEFLIIAGAAVGTLLSGNPIYVLKKIAGGLVSVLKGPTNSKQRYIDLLKMMYTLFNKARKEGLAGIESDIEEPEKSAVFSKYPEFLGNHHVRDFVCDTMRMAITGGASAFDLDQMMEIDMDVHHAGATESATALSTMADSLPGMGIVAAVLGVVVTMSSLGGPPEEIGHKVAAALVGTFLGILLCYGVVGPLGVESFKAGRQRARFLSRAARGDAGVHQGNVAFAGDRDGAARDSRTCASDLQGSGHGVPPQGRAGGGSGCIKSYRTEDCGES